MPELPEVEHVRRTMRPVLKDVRVSGVTIIRPDYVRTPAAELRQLVGRQVRAVRRHGKNIFCIFDDDHTLVIHLGMTGGVFCVGRDQPPRAHTHVIFRLASGRQLHLRDPRRFGGLWFYPTFQAAWRGQVEGKLGVDALRLAPRHLEAWAKSRGRLKAALLAQDVVAGLGNIYVDESLWLSRLHPRQMLCRLSPCQIAGLVRNIHRILRRSIRLGGTTVRDYRNVWRRRGRFAAHLAVYGRAGKPCRRCGAALRSDRTAGRTTVFCPCCQLRH